MTERNFRMRIALKITNDMTEHAKGRVQRVAGETGLIEPDRSDLAHVCIARPQTDSPWLRTPVGEFVMRLEAVKHLRAISF